jgi:hypothetical protein
MSYVLVHISVKFKRLLQTGLSESNPERCQNIIKQQTMKTRLFFLHGTFNRRLKFHVYFLFLCIQSENRPPKLTL